MIETPLNQYVFRAWFVLFFSLIYDYFSTKEKHFKPIGRKINLALRVLAFGMAILLISIVLSPNTNSILIHNNGNIELLNVLPVKYNYVKWLVLLLPGLMIIEEKLLRKIDPALESTKKEVAATREE